MPTALDIVNPAAGSERTGTNRFSELSSEDFIKVLFTQLQNQDPLQPNDTNAMLEQLSSLRNIESQLSLQDQLSSLVLQNQVASAGNLIGKVVEGLNDSNDTVSGQVTSVRIAGDDVQLELDSGQTLSMSRIVGVSDPNALNI